MHKNSPCALRLPRTLIITNLNNKQYAKGKN
jgi:hypothetical protein